MCRSEPSGIQSRDVVTNLIVALSESVQQGHRKELSNVITKGLMVICGFAPSAVLIYENEAPNVNVL